MPETKFPPRWTQTSTQERLSCDDLEFCGGQIDLTVEKVTEVHCPGERYEWQLSIKFAEIRKPYRPCVTVAKRLGMALGKDIERWNGVKMRLVLDSTVRHGKEQVGGVRVTHLSGLSSPFVGMFCSSGGRRMSFQFDPLPVAAPESSAGNRVKIVSALFAEAETEEQFNRAKEAGANLSKTDKQQMVELYNAAEKRVMQDGRPCLYGGQLVTEKWCAGLCDSRERCKNGPARQGTVS